MAATSVAERQHTTHSEIFTVFYICPNCENGIVALIRILVGTTPHNYPSGIINSGRYQIFDTFPKGKPLAAAPDHLPENIKGLFLQAADNLKRGHFHSSTMMCRRILDIAIRTIAPAVTGTLYERIERLASQNLITNDIKDWAHEVRLIGNDAAHGDDLINKIDAHDIFYFTELFLQYVFTLPGLLNVRKNAKQKTSP